MHATSDGRSAVSIVMDCMRASAAVSAQASRVGFCTRSKTASAGEIPKSAALTYVLSVVLRRTKLQLVVSPTNPFYSSTGATCSYQYQMGSVLVSQSPVKGGVAETWVNTQQAFHNVGSISPGSRASVNHWITAAYASDATMGTFAFAQNFDNKSTDMRVCGCEHPGPANFLEHDVPCLGVHRQPLRHLGAL